MLTDKERAWLESYMSACTGSSVRWSSAGAQVARKRHAADWPCTAKAEETPRGRKEAEAVTQRKALRHCLAARLLSG